MAVSYKKLWKLLIDKGLNKTQLCAEAGITTNAMARLGRDEDVRVEVLVKICSALNCTMDDITPSGSSAIRFCRSSLCRRTWPTTG